MTNFFIYISPKFAIVLQVGSRYVALCSPHADRSIVQNHLTISWQLWSFDSEQHKLFQKGDPRPRWTCLAFSEAKNQKKIAAKSQNKKFASAAANNRDGRASIVGPGGWLARVLARALDRSRTLHAERSFRTWSKTCCCVAAWQRLLWTKINLALRTDRPLEIDFVNGKAPTQWRTSILEFAYCANQIGINKNNFKRAE